MNSNTSDPHTASPDSASITPETDSGDTRHLSPAERILGLALGHTYRVTTPDPDTPNKLFFVRKITHLDSWNNGSPPNTHKDFTVTFYHTTITNESVTNDIATAGNIYDITDDNTHGPLQLNASLITQPECIDEIPPDPTWFPQDPDTITPLEPTSEITQLLTHNLRAVPTP